MASQNISLFADESTAEKHTDNSIQQVETEASTSTTITDLPMEVLVYLLNKLKNYDDLISCTMVTRTFFDASSWLLEDYHCFAFNGDRNDKKRSLDYKMVETYGGIRESTVRLLKCTVFELKWLSCDIAFGVTRLELNACILHWTQLGDLLLRFENLESLTVTMNLRYCNCRPPMPQALNCLTFFMGDVEDSDWEDAKAVLLAYKWKHEPKATLRKLNLDIMLPTASSFLILLITHIYKNKLALEEFSVKTYYEETKLLMYEKSDYYRNPLGGLVNIPGLAQFYGTVRCAELFRINRNSLKKIVICCASSFPYAGGWPTVADPDEDLNLESALRQRLAEALFDDLFESMPLEEPWTFPNLRALAIDIPLVLISQDSLLLRYMEHLVDFNDHIKHLELKGLHLQEGDEALIKDKFLDYTDAYCFLGLKAVSIKPGNLRYFSNNLVEITMDVMGDYRKKFSSLFLPEKSKPGEDAIVFRNLRYFSAANGSSYMRDYALENLVPRFPNLKELYLRDLSLMNLDISLPIRSRYSDTAKLLDQDIQSILQNLKCLERLHLHCDMFDVTDYGLTGINTEGCCQIRAKPGLNAYLNKTDKVGLSFSALKNLKYLFLFYTGPLITEVTARCAFKGLNRLKYFKYDSCELTYRSRILMYKKILATSPSCRIDTYSKDLFSNRISEL